jgi:integrase
MNEESLSEIVVLDADPTPADDHALVPLKRRLPNDRNPMLLYLGRLTGETSAKTMARVLKRVGAVIASWMGADDVPYDQLPWHMLRYQHVARLRSQWAQAGLKPRTINQYLSAVKGVIDEAENLGLIPPDDARRVEKVKGLKIRDELLAGRSIEDDEVRALVSACDTSVMGLRNHALLALLFGGGLRRREVSKVRIGDFDAAHGEVRVRGKGAKERLVPLSPDAVTMVKAWLVRRGTSDGNGAPLLVAFTLEGEVKRANGAVTHLTSSGVYRVLCAIAEKANVRDISPHDARRTRITEMLLAGENIVTVQRIAGHESVETTGRYVRTGQEAARESAARVPMLKRKPAAE